MENLQQEKSQQPFIVEEILPKPQSKVKEFIKKFLKRKTAVISLCFIAFLAIVAMFAPHIVPFDTKAPEYSGSEQSRVGKE